VYTGSLEVGYAGDFVVLDPNILNDNSLLKTTKVELVVVGGNVVYEKSKDLEPIEPCPMGGPFIPGKNGQIIDKKRRINEVNRRNRTNKVEDDMMCSPALALNCACRLLGKYCIASYR
jgi:hypothetical protein